MLEDESQVVIHQLSGIVVETVVPGVLAWLNQLRLFLPSAFVADAVPLSVISPYFDVDGLARVIYTCSTGCSLVTLTTVIKTPVCWISSTKGSDSIVYFFEYNYIYTRLPASVTCRPYVSDGLASVLQKQSWSPRYWRYKVFFEIVLLKVYHISKLANHHFLQLRGESDDIS